MTVVDLKSQPDDLQMAQSRLWSAEVALDVPSRLLKAFAGSGVFDDDQMEEWTAKADLPGAIALQKGTMADMDLVARIITAD